MEVYSCLAAFPLGLCAAIFMRYCRKRQEAEKEKRFELIVEDGRKQVVTLHSDISEQDVCAAFDKAIEALS